jgi:predicted RNase H-like nuclease (RuvC/YqgF family)
MEIEFETEIIQNNDNELDRLRKEIEELKYQLDREQRDGEKLKRMLNGNSGWSHSPRRSVGLNISMQQHSSNFSA